MGGWAALLALLALSPFAVPVDAQTSTLCDPTGAATTVTTNSSLNAQIAIWANGRCRGTIVIGRRGKSVVANVHRVSYTIRTP
jgi:K+-sensing histidine kinase KdpD